MGRDGMKIVDDLIGRAAYGGIGSRSVPVVPVRRSCLSFLSVVSVWLCHFCLARQAGNVSEEGNVSQAA